MARHAHYQIVSGLVTGSMETLCAHSRQTLRSVPARVFLPSERSQGEALVLGALVLGGPALGGRTNRGVARGEAHPLSLL